MLSDDQDQGRLLIGKQKRQRQQKVTVQIRKELRKGDLYRFDHIKRPLTVFLAAGGGGGEGREGRGVGAAAMVLLCP